jgi:hypothetical protein
MEVTPLELWLQRASRCLAESSVAQVRREIQEHYESAREAAIEDGIAPEQAAAAALASLGDPARANRAYRKVLLTATEVRVLNNAAWERRVVCSRPKLVWLMRAIPAAAFTAAAILFNAGFESGARMLFQLALCAALFFLAPTLPLYTPSRARLFRRLKWSLIIALNVLALIPIMAEWVTFAAIIMSTAVYEDWIHRSIRRKLPVEQWPKSLYL